MHQLNVIGNGENSVIGKFTRVDETLQSKQKYLLLIHGIFSSSEGAFGEFRLNRWGDEMLLKLDKSYNKIISFDHWTVAKSTLENANELLAMLPPDCHIDIVWHSRGAGVTRCLLEHPSLATEVSNRKIKVGKVIFVAGACQGSPLARPENLGKLLNMFSALSSISGSYIPLKLFTGLLKAVQYGVKHFPSIHSMTPDSDILKQLNKPINQKDCEYIYTRSNYEQDGSLKKMLDEAAIDNFIFDNKSNDGVVPFEGAGTFDKQVTNSITVTEGPEFGIHDHVYHTAFFEQQSVRQMLIKHLASDNKATQITRKKRTPVDETA